MLVRSEILQFLKYSFRFTPSKAAGFQATLLEAAVRAAGAGVISAKFFGQLFVTMNKAVTFLDLCFGRKALPAFAGEFLKRSLRCGFWLT